MMGTLKIDNGWVKRVGINLMIFLVLYIIPVHTVFIPVFIGLLIYYHIKNKIEWVIILGIYSLCTRSELVYYAYSVTLAFIVFFDKSRAIGKSKVHKGISKGYRSLIIYLILTYIIQLFTEGSYLSFPFLFVTFFSPMFIMFYIWKRGLSHQKLNLFFQSFLALGIAQAIIALVFQAIPIGIGNILGRATLADSIWGTTNSAPKLGMILVFSILPFVVSYFGKIKIKNRNIFFLIFIPMAFFIYLLDAKTLLFSIFLGAFAVYLSKKFFYKPNVLFFLLFSLVIVISSSIVIVKFKGILNEYDKYITGDFNSKLLYYQSTFNTNTRSTFEFYFGTGGGTNGSRAANALAYDVLYKKENTLKLPDFIPAKSNDFTRNYLSKYYTEEYATTGSRSSVLGNPFNSVCAFFVEFGVIGFMLFIVYLGSLYKPLMRANNTPAHIAVVLLASCIISSFLDQAFERTASLHLMYSFIGVGLASLGAVVPLRTLNETPPVIVEN